MYILYIWHTQNDHKRTIHQFIPDAYPTQINIKKRKQSDVCFINAGNIRNNTAYPLDKTRFTYKDLKVHFWISCIY